MSKEYTWNYYNNDYWNYGEFDSIEECVNDALADDELETDEIFIGEVNRYHVQIDGYYFLCDLEEEADQEYGEAADNWLPSASDRKEISKLSDQLTELVNSWLKENHCLPDFYHIENIRLYNIKEGRFVD